MGIDSNYLHILFSNLHFLLSNNINKNDLHRVEVEYLEDSLQLFNDVNNNIASFAANKDFDIDKLNNFYAIPSLLRAYDKQKNFLKKLFPQNNQSREKFFKTIYKHLKDYSENKPLDIEVQVTLATFFLYLARQFESNYSFERIDELNRKTSKSQLVHHYVA